MTIKELMQVLQYYGERYGWNQLVFVGSGNTTTIKSVGITSPPDKFSIEGT